MCQGLINFTYKALLYILLKSFGRLVTAPNSFSINFRPTRVRFARESERIQIDTSVQSNAQEMFNECFEPTSSSPMSDLDLNNSMASSGFEYIPKGPAQSLILKCTNPQQLEVGSCYF